MSTEIYDLYRGEKRAFSVDFGENTAGATTGKLSAGDTLSSVAVTVHSKPTGATDPTIGTVTVNASAIYVKERECSAGEAATFFVTLASDQAYGTYVLKAAGTTTATEVIADPLTFVCKPLA